MSRIGDGGEPVSNRHGLPAVPKYTMFMGIPRLEREYFQSADGNRVSAVCYLFLGSAQFRDEKAA